MCVLVSKLGESRHTRHWKQVRSRFWLCPPTSKRMFEVASVIRKTTMEEAAVNLTEMCAVVEERSHEDE